MHSAEWIVWLLNVYAGFGAVFAVAFVARGVDRIDATEKTIGFRLMILPGVVAMWPLLLGRWVGGPTVEP